MKKSDRIFIAGCNDLIGKSLLMRLREEGFRNLIVTPHSGLDFTDQKAVSSFFKATRPRYCFLTSIKEGGIGANIAYPADLIYRNLTAQTNVIHSAWEAKVEKLIFFASSCVYPKGCPQPMREEHILSGALETTSEPYSIAKIAGIKMCQAYNKQFGTSFISVIPATAFGQEDNFDSDSSHVVAALIKKFCEAKIGNAPKVTIWGSGKPKREFIYADDLIDASLFLMKHKNIFEIINIGTGVDISIRDLAQTIKEIVDFKGRIEFDNSKPGGVSRKLLSIQRLKSLGWRPKTGLRLGLEEVCFCYLEKFRWQTA